jgi:hypothetical protein
MWKISMIAAMHDVAVRFQHGGIVVRTIGFVMARHGAIELASVLSMVPYQAIEVCHTRAICCVESKEQLRDEKAICWSIPNVKTLPL